MFVSFLKKNRYAFCLHVQKLKQHRQPEFRLKGSTISFSLRVPGIT